MNSAQQTTGTSVDFARNGGRVDDLLIETLLHVIIANLSKIVIFKKISLFQKRIRYLSRLTLVFQTKML